MKTQISLGKNRSIRTKLLVLLLLTSIAIYMVVIGIVAYRTNKTAKYEAKRITNLYAEEYATQSSQKLGEYMSIIRTITQQFQDYENVDYYDRRNNFSRILVNLMEQNPSYMSLWTIWEPMSIDKRDKDFYWKEGSTALGNFSPTYFRANGKINLQAVTKDTVATPLMTGDYYVLPKKRMKETILNPYYYSYTDSEHDKIFQTNLISPIIVNNKFHGVVGFDVPLVQLQEMMANIKPYEESYAFMITNDGILVTHPDKDNAGKTISEILGKTDTKYGITKGIKNGEILTDIIYEDKNGKQYYISFAPVEIGNTDTPWSVAIAVPYSVIMADAYMQLFIIILASILGLGIIAFVIVLVSNKIAFPITQATAVLEDMSVGKIDRAEQMVVFTSDELGQMAKALVRLAISIRKNTDFAHYIGEGKFNKEYVSAGKEDLLGNALVKMQQNLQKYSETQEKNSWIQNQTVKLGEILRGEKKLEELSSDLLGLFAKSIDMMVGALYVCNKENNLELIGSFAYDTRRASALKFKMGEGLVGQTAKEKRILVFTDVPDDYMVIQSGLGKTKPVHILFLPLVHNNVVLGVIELGFKKELPDLHREFLNTAVESISIGFNSFKIKDEVNKLLEKTIEQSEALQLQQTELRKQNEELQVQQESLKKSNVELEEKSEELKQSEQSLQTQQEELRVINEELEEKTKTLELQSEKVKEQNISLEGIRRNLEKKAEELEISSKYKSEFLANMSHELRTPLNSLLILSKNLSENREKNLNDDQIESLGIIYQSGHDLLKLINDILDLSKIESGKMILNFETFASTDIVHSLKHGFQHMAEEKKIGFEIKMEKDFPEKLTTDFQRLGQVLKNIISNAIKFTENGKISIILEKANKNQNYNNEKLRQHDVICFRVKDTGVGIPKEKLNEIFEAFLQVDGSTSRTYGGTGLGLSISRELIKLLGGEIQLESKLGKGSDFVVFLPVDNVVESTEKTEVVVTPEKKSSSDKEEGEKKTMIIENTKVEKVILSTNYQIEDDRENLKKNDKILLIVEDDVHFARILQKQSNNIGFKTLVATRGADGLALAEAHLPSAVILDIKLPDIDGRKVLDALKRNADTRHIPVHMMSASNFTKDILERGAIGFTSKPVTPEQLALSFNKIEAFVQREMKELLIVEDDDNLRKSIRILIGDKGINITEAKSGKETLDLLKEKTFDCMVLDLGLPDMTGFDLLKKIEKNKKLVTPPVIVYTGREISKEENEELAKYAKSIIIKGVKSEDRLLDESALFLHRVVKELPEEHQNIITTLHDKDQLFVGKKVMIVDDEMRNVFALSKILIEKEMEVVKAENGQVGIDKLNENPNVDLILMDIMMPVMDGYEAISKIRSIHKLKNIPIIALTAKAMKKDHQKCIEAGANDYLSKPLDVDRLFSLMRVWLYNN
jgi:CheY-like chemotaxis protein/signal transduction histidine kinase